MQLHQLKPNHKQRKSRRVGRGGKRGTYSGRGGKGQKARAGHRVKPIIRELIKRYPKLRGHKFSARKTMQTVVNLGILDKHFPEQSKVTPQVLIEKRIIRRIKGRTPSVKVLGQGKLTKALVFEGLKFSKSAREAAEKSGSKIS